MSPENPTPMEAAHACAFREHGSAQQEPRTVRYDTDPSAFRAVMLHELAHLRNRDVDKTYFTIGIWRAFVVVALIPFLILNLHPVLLYDPWEASICTVRC